ncbi:MAG: hypothetical protein HJJLKODD_01202 [Phycisphaerae bacterium]|nr:hypothetical protein [Phycisphaerae bacterium]
MTPMIEIFCDTDRPAIKALVEQHWAGAGMCIKGDLCYPHQHDGFVARADQQIVGWITFICHGPTMMLSSLNSLRKGLGIGSNLVLRTVDEARKRGVGRIWLTTTNDNLHALWFYQRLGFRLVAIYPDSINQARSRLKPSIPEHGPNGLLINDEIELELQLSPYTH